MAALKNVNKSVAFQPQNEDELRENSSVLLSQLKNGIRELKHPFERSFIDNSFRNASTPAPEKKDGCDGGACRKRTLKYRHSHRDGHPLLRPYREREPLSTEKKEDNYFMSPAEDPKSFEVYLKAKGNLRRRKVHDDNKVLNHQSSCCHHRQQVSSNINDGGNGIEMHVKKKKQKIASPSKLNHKSLVTRSNQPDKSMMGYDWIAGMLDNESYISEQTDVFFKDIEHFRRLHRDECKGNIKDNTKDNTKKKDVKYPDTRIDTIPGSITATNEKKYPLCCNGGGSYVVNNRLNMVPVHGPYSQCPVCKGKIKFRDDVQDNYVRVSIPRTAIKSPYKLRPHRRTSYNPADSVSISSHCLAGWESSRPTHVPGPSAIDLVSHSSKNGLTTVVSIPL